MEKFLYWMTRRNGEWYGLNDPDLIETAPKHPGVYMIWVEGELIPNEDRVIHSGQTKDISKRFSQHQSGPTIIRHARAQHPRADGIVVSWARVESSFDRNRIEAGFRGLADPHEENRFPDVEPIEVNLPFIQAEPDINNMTAKEFDEQVFPPLEIDLD